MRNCLRIAVLELIGGIALAAYAQSTVYVNGTTGDDAWDGRCEAWDGGTCGPKHTIQAGIDAAVAGDEVLIADGIYRYAGNRNLDFAGKAITVRSAGDDPTTCVIDCSSGGRGFYFHSYETSASVVRGLTIRNAGHTQGGGVYCSHSSPSLINCALTGNRAMTYGGGIYCLYSAATLVGCTLIGNVSQSLGGGAVACYSSDVSLINCVIRGNYASNGGGLYCVSGSAATLDRCVLGYNDAGEGGAIYSASSSPKLTNCLLIGNSAYSGSAAICYAGWPALINCTITGNLGSTGSGAVQCSDSHPQLTNCILWANSPSEIAGNPTVTYCDVQGGWTGVGNIDVNPDFAFPGDFHLMPTSACVDAGTDNPTGGLPAEDFEDQPRIMDGDGDSQPRSDLGMYELSPGLPLIALSASELTFNVPVGEAASQTLGIRNSSLGTLAWELSWSADWLSADASGGESAGEIDLVTLAANTQGLAHGRYDATLYVCDPHASNSPRAVAVVLYVNATISVPEAYPTIQEAINVSVPGDELLLADGIYTGPGNRNLNFHGKAIHVESASGDPDKCIIDCEYSGGGLRFSAQETADTLVRGITIRNGCYDGSGAGVYCWSSSPTLIDCVISGNVNGCNGGGAVYCSAAHPTLINCAIIGNTSLKGDAYGGGLYCHYATPTLVNCVIADNTAVRGGGLYSAGFGRPLLTNCTFTGNSADLEGGGAVYCSGSSSDAVLTNCILWGDTPQEICAPSSNPTVAFCDVQGGWPGAGNIDVDPGFAFPNDLHLVRGSACIDAGTNEPAVGLPVDDIEGQPRPTDGDGDGLAIADLGAYEFSRTAPELALSATEFTFSCPMGAQASQTLQIRNRTLGTLAWALNPGAAWLSATPAAGDSSGEVDIVTLSADASDLEHGRYDAVLWVVDPQTSDILRAIPIVLYVNAELRVPDAYATIQAAIDAGVPGDEVVLADGIYTGEGNRNLDFRGKAIRLCSASDEPTACVIDCERADYGMRFRGRDLSNSRVRGLTISNAARAGVYCDFASPTVRKCAIVGNTVGVYCDSSYATLSGCIISGNSGGGVYCDRSPLNVLDCIIAGNAAPLGAGVYCDYYSDASFRNCVLINNTAGEDGGGFYCDFSTPMLVNCTFANNTAGRDGGAVYNTRAVVGPVLVNCILTADSPQEISDPSEAMQVSYSDVCGGWTGTGNIDADPAFVDADGADNDPATWTDNDYRLTPGSPCVDVGDPALATPPGERDLDGHLRRWDGNADGTAVIDLGAFEFASRSYGDLNCDGTLNVFDIDPFVLALTDPARYVAAFSGCNALLADCNGDGSVNVFDIDPFVVLLTND